MQPCRDLGVVWVKFTAMIRYIYSIAFGMLSAASLSAQTPAPGCGVRDRIKSQPLPFVMVKLYEPQVEVPALNPVEQKETACLVRGTSFRFGKKDDKPYSGFVYLYQYDAENELFPVDTFSVASDGSFSFVVNGREDDRFLIAGMDEVSDCADEGRFSLGEMAERGVLHLQLDYRCLHCW